MAFLDDATTTAHPDSEATMSINLALHVPFHPSEIEDLLLSDLPATLSPFLDEEFPDILFRFGGELVRGYASSEGWSDDLLDGGLYGGPLSLAFRIGFGMNGPAYLAIPRMLHFTASVLKARSEDVLLTREEIPMLLRRNGQAVLTTRDCWSPGYFDALGFSGPRKPLCLGDPGWEAPSTPTDVA